eukprot:TRINITY_DN5456_c0_g1_i1.p1 TRINITY_DN5456_c0_g1~~TRINITY_DN5456_c0_g1_i1.p1  ORF type:complete len:447 (+),score=40.70 TRINITY_DN5456_c0_g1_i1:36-1376(+)
MLQLSVFVCLLLLVEEGCSRGSGGRGGGSGRQTATLGKPAILQDNEVKEDPADPTAENKERERRHVEETDKRLRELEERLQEDKMALENDHTALKVPPRLPRGRPPQQHTMSENKPLVKDKALLTKLFNTALEVVEEEPSVNQQDTKPHWATTETDNGLKSFAFGVVEELGNSIKGRLPCNPLQYVVSHSDWLVAYKRTGLLVDIGVGSGLGLRVLATGFPDREVLGIGDAGNMKILDNVKIRVGAAGLAGVISEGNYKEIALAHFSCTDFSCISMTFGTLKPLFKPGTTLIFSKAVGYPGYLEDGLRILYETMSTLPDLGFELIGGRHLNAQGHMCLTHRPKHDACPQSLALRFVAPTDVRPRVLPGGHMLPKSMPLVSQMCPGLPSLDEQFIRGQATLNSTLGSLKTHLISQISSLVINREESSKREHKLKKTMLDTQNRLLVC